VKVVVRIVVFSHPLEVYGRRTGLSRNRSMNGLISDGILGLLQRNSVHA